MFSPSIALHRNASAFAEYVAAAEEHGIENYSLCEWTKATITDPAKKENYLKSFTLYVNERQTADTLEAHLQPLATRGSLRECPSTIRIPNPQSPQCTSERG